MSKICFHIGIFLSFELVFVIAAGESNQTVVNNGTYISRRILTGQKTLDTRPYMVYLRPAPTADKLLHDSDWMCGGVIIHPRYILTSAACIENVKQFYIVSGTHRWAKLADDCVRYGAKKAVWKCIPDDYHYDGNEFDNILWLVNDIAVVKVEDEFNFERRVRGCDFVPSMIGYNNKSTSLEAPMTHGYTAGWGSVATFVEGMQKANNSPELLETDIQIIDTKECKQAWPERYHHFIEVLLCGHDSDGQSPCSNLGVNCKDVKYDQVTLGRTRHHVDDTRRFQNGGFCENDHGGPLVVGQGKGAIVAGIITASQTNEKSQCVGPFLFTSTWRHRRLIDCALGYYSSAGRKCSTRQVQPLDSNYTLSISPNDHMSTTTSNNTKSK